MVAEKPRRIGILGGTFDPIHIGHISIAQQAREKLDLEKVILIPCNLPPHKSKGAVAPAVHRLAMAKEAIRNMRGLSVSDVELRREGASYTVDTLREMKRDLGEETQLYLIMGADAIPDLAKWKDPEEILRLAEPVIVTRPGCSVVDMDSCKGVLSDEAVRRLRAGILAIEPVDVSSTEIRRRLAEGHSIDKMVRHCVKRYIGQHGLYRKRRRR